MSSSVADPPKPELIKEISDGADAVEAFEHLLAPLLDGKLSDYSAMRTEFVLPRLPVKLDSSEPSSSEASTPARPSSVFHRSPRDPISHRASKVKSTDEQAQMHVAITNV